MHLREAWHEVRAHPVRFVLATVIPTFLIELASHAFYSWILEHVKEGASPLLEKLGKFAVFNVEHRVYAFFATFGVLVALLLVYEYVRQWIASIEADGAAKAVAELEHEKRLSLIEQRLTTGEAVARDLATNQAAQTEVLTALERFVSERKEKSDEAYDLLSGRLDDLQSNVPLSRKTTKTLEAAIDIIPTFVSVISGVSVLIEQADTAVRLLYQIKETLHPQSEAAQRPFSKAWWHNDVIPKPDPLVIGWALLVNRHKEKCVEFAAVYSILLSTVLREDLQVLVGTWSQNIPMETCQQTLESQRGRLIALRQEQIQNVGKQILQRGAS